MLPINAMNSGPKVKLLVGSSEQNALLGELDGMKDPFCRWEDLMHLSTCYGVVNLPLQVGVQRRDKVQTEVEGLKCSSFVLVSD